MVPKPSEYAHGPSMKDNRRTRTKKYRRNAINEWKAYFKEITETRWDNFEDFIYTIAEEVMIDDFKLVEETDWKMVFEHVFNKLGKECKSNEDIKELPDIPFVKKEFYYKGKTVKLKDFADYFER